MFSSKTILITGASSGIGEAARSTLRSRGASRGTVARRIER